MRRQFVFLLFVLLVWRFVTPAAAEQPVIWGEHVVQPGENLFRIAQQYNLTTSQLAAQNGIYNSAYIYVGQTLRVPQSSDLLTSSRSQPASPQQESATHIVQYGESLYQIAVRYEISVAALQQLNHLTPAQTIYPGEVIILPVQGLLDAASWVNASPQKIELLLPDEADALTTIVVNEERPPLTYAVQPGDTLWGIAKRFEVNITQLQAYNNIYNPNQLVSGRQIYIPNGSETVPPLAVLWPTAMVGPQRPTKQIVVDLSDQKVESFENGQPVHQFTVSTGAPGMETRTGTFYVQNKLPAGYNYSWGMTMPNWMGIYWAGSLQNGFHALPILSDGTQLWEGYLGTRISYGCIVLGNADAAQLYQWSEVGTEVVIQP